MGRFVARWYSHFVFRALAQTALCTVIASIAFTDVACAGPSTTADASPDESQSSAQEQVSVWDAANRPHADIVFIHCRGGRGFEFKSLGFKPTRGGDMLVAVSLTFASSGKPPGSTNQNLEPGTCAPADRAFGAAEPREVHFLTAAFSQPFIGPIDTTPAAAEHHPDVRSIAGYLKDPGHYWTFNAADTKRGYFDAWVHQYWSDLNARPPRSQSDDEPQPRADDKWLVRVSIAGGIGGSSTQVSVGADGRLLASSSSSHLRCSTNLPATTVQSIAAAIDRSHPETWAPAYVLKANPNGCCDQFRQLIHVEREDAQQRRTTRETYWFSDSAHTIPEGVRSLSKVLSEVRAACSAF